MIKNTTLLILLLLGYLKGYTQQPTNIDRVVAVVGDKAILYSEIESQRLQARQQGVDLGPNARAVILDQLIFQKLLLHYSEVDSLEVTESQINNELEARIRYFEQQIGGRKKLEEFYGKSISEIKEEFYDIIKEKLLSEAMQRKITESVRVTPSEVEEFFNSIPKDSLPFMNSQVELSHIVMIPKVTEEEKKKVKEDLEKTRQRIMSGESSFCFEAIDSDDPGTRSRCGEWDFIPRGTFVPEFDAVAFRLKDGQFSEVFETSYGYHFMQLIQRRGEEYKGRHILKIPKVSSDAILSVSNKLDSIFKLLENKQIGFEQAVLKFSEEEESKNNFGKVVNPYTGNNRFEVSELEPQVFIVVDKLNPGEYSRPVPFTTKDGKQGYRILRLNLRTSPHQANLSDDYQVLKDAAQSTKEEKAVDEWVKSKAWSTYIWIEDSLKDAEYRYPWVKKS